MNNKKTNIQNNYTKKTVLIYVCNIIISIILGTQFFLEKKYFNFIIAVIIFVSALYCIKNIKYCDNGFKIINDNKRVNNILSLLLIILTIISVVAGILIFIKLFI